MFLFLNQRIDRKCQWSTTMMMEMEAEMKPPVG